MEHFSGSREVVIRSVGGVELDRKAVLIESLPSYLDGHSALGPIQTDHDRRRRA
jgi:hypothetical protein